MARKFVIWDDSTGELGSTSAFSRSWLKDLFDSPFWDNIPDKPSEFPPEAHAHSPSDISPQGDGSGLDADTVDGEHASAFTHAENGGKHIWVQSEAPTAIEVGDIWIVI